VSVNVDLNNKGFIPGRHLFDSYGNGGFRFANMSHKGSVLALPSGIYAWPVKRFEDLINDDFYRVLQESHMIDTLLIGCGDLIATLPKPLYWFLKDGNMSIDVMGTGAATRIYNIMQSENRRVAAALIAIGHA
jgi:uncharacterized protein